MVHGVGWRRTVADVTARCAHAGLDLVSPLQVRGYNEVVEAGFRLPDFGRARALAVLIGNTKAIWRPFLDALGSRPRLLDDDHPLDTYISQAIHDALQPLGDRWELRWAHRSAPRPVAMQRLAHVSGLAHLAPSHLSVHPVYGPWISLRAVVVVDIDGPSDLAPEPLNPCDNCVANCLARFDQAIAAVGPSQTHDTVAEHWRRWLAVRDACPIGRAHRFSDDQIRYHYTKDPQVLRRLAGVDASRDRPTLRCR